MNDTELAVAVVQLVAEAGGQVPSLTDELRDQLRASLTELVADAPERLVAYTDAVAGEQKRLGLSPDAVADAAPEGGDANVFELIFEQGWHAVPDVELIRFAFNTDSLFTIAEGISGSIGDGDPLSTHWREVARRLNRDLPQKADDHRVISQLLIDQMRQLMLSHSSRRTEA